MSKQSKGRIQVHSFSLLIESTKLGYAELADALYGDGGLDDGSLGEREGRLMVDFDREAPSYAEANKSAKRQLETIEGVLVVALYGHEEAS